MLIRALFLWLALTLPGLAQSLPDPISDSLSDYAGLLTPAEAARITQTLQRGRAETGVQVALVIMERLSDHGGAGQRIEDYAKSLFNAWGIGDASRNAGILILVARTDREMRIALGAGYDVMWDNAAQRVIDRDMLPAFGDDRYGDGIEAGIAATFAQIARPHRAGDPAPPAPAADYGQMIAIVMAVLWGAGLFAMTFRDRLSGVALKLRPCPTCGARALTRDRTVLTPATSIGAGSASDRIFCTSCQYERITVVPIAQTRDAGPSDSGFGGGSSSGGGATGKW